MRKLLPLSVIMLSACEPLPPPVPPQPPPELVVLQQACANGDVQACAVIYQVRAQQQAAQQAALAQMASGNRMQPGGAVFDVGTAVAAGAVAGQAITQSR